MVWHDREKKNLPIHSGAIPQEWIARIYSTHNEWMYSLLNPPPAPFRSPEKVRASVRFCPFNLLTRCTAGSQRLAGTSRSLGGSFIGLMTFTLPRYIDNSWYILFWVVSFTLLFEVYCLFTVIRSRFGHCVWATANMTLFLLLFHTLAFMVFFSVLCNPATLHIAHTDFHTNPLMQISIGRE